MTEAARSAALHQRVQAAIAGAGWSGGVPFDPLARAVFEHQFLGCAPYRAYCEGRGVTPDTLGAVADIPAVPTDVFKSVPLTTFPPEDATTTFLTSGTTVGTRGRHLLRSTATYEASLAPWLRRWLIPGGSAPRTLALVAPLAEDPHSSLGHMVQWAVDRGASGSRHCWSEGPDLDALAAAVDGDAPVLLLATARALQHLLEERLAHRPMPLPPGSCVMETGGFKGAARTLERDDFYGRLQSGLSVPRHAIVSEYGMTELGSQGYQPGWAAAHDARIAAALKDAPDGLRDPEGVLRTLLFPPWCRVEAVDPETLRPLPAGERGLLRFFDLANVDTVLAVQTSDVGVVTPFGVRLDGRDPTATPRGCSLAVDEILAAR